MTPVDVARWITDRCALILAARLTRRMEDVEALAVEAHRTALDALALAREHAKEPKSALLQRFNSALRPSMDAKPPLGTQHEAPSTRVLMTTSQREQTCVAPLTGDAAPN
jgi:hypothetical protein